MNCTAKGEIPAYRSVALGVTRTVGGRYPRHERTRARYHHGQRLSGIHSASRAGPAGTHAAADGTSRPSSAAGEACGGARIRANGRPDAAVLRAGRPVDGTRRHGARRPRPRMAAPRLLRSPPGRSRVRPQGPAPSPGPGDTAAAGPGSGQYLTGEDSCATALFRALCREGPEQGYADWSRRTGHAPEPLRAGRGSSASCRPRPAGSSPRPPRASWPRRCGRSSARPRPW